jgi:GH18 family chitinase
MKQKSDFNQGMKRWKYMRNNKRWAQWIMIAAIFNACKKTEIKAPQGGGTTPVTPAAPVIKAPPALGSIVAGYFPSYRDPNAIPDQKFKMCNVVNYAFGTVAANGNIVIQSPNVFGIVANKAKSNGAKVFLSIFGSTTDWQQMAATPAGRNTFVKQAMLLVRTNALHGIDIDWEYPSTADGTSVTYTKLLQELGDSLHLDGKYYLSAAITSGKYAGQYRDAITKELLQGEQVDFFNIMAYDDFSTTAPYRHHSDLKMAETCLNYWINTAGMPKRKAVLGVPAYGRPSGITQTGTIQTYAAILSKGGSANSDSATVSATGFPAYTIYYNGQLTVKRKAILGNTQGSGVMMWEMGQDSNDNTSLLKAACDTLGRSYQ